MNLYVTVECFCCEINRVLCKTFQKFKRFAYIVSRASYTYYIIDLPSSVHVMKIYFCEFKSCYVHEIIRI